MPLVKFVGHGSDVVVPLLNDRTFVYGVPTEVSEDELEFLLKGPFELVEEEEEEVSADVEPEEEADAETALEPDDNEGEFE